MKKYEITNIKIEYEGHTLYRIKSLRQFLPTRISRWVDIGELGGFVESKKNLSQDDDSWIYEDAMAMENAYVCDNATLYSNVIVRENARVEGNSCISNNAKVSGNAQVKDNAFISDNAQIYGYACICDDTEIRDNAKVYGGATVLQNAIVQQYARVYGNSIVGIGDGFSKIGYKNGDCVENQFGHTLMMRNSYDDNPEIFKQDNYGFIYLRG